MPSLIATSPSSILVATLVSVLAVLTSNPVLAAISLSTWIFLFVFFRGFAGSVDPRPHVLVSPCEGTLSAVFAHKDRLRLVVSLHLFDRHVQIAPVDGTVAQQVYKPGEFNPVFLSEKTHLNERMDTVFLSDTIGTVVVTQIAGQLARRIATFVSPGELVEKGQEIGIIKFGSQCEIDVPFSHRALFLARVGDKLLLGQNLILY